MTHHQTFRGRHALGLVGLLLFAAGCGESDNTQQPPVPPPDEAPPLSPIGVSVSRATDEAFSVSWAANSESDLAGYLVYEYDPDPTAPDPYRLLTAQPIRSNRFSSRVDLDATGGRPSELYLRVTAVDTSGNESGMSSTLRVSLQPSVGNVDQDPTSDDDGSGGGRGPSNGGTPGGDGGGKEPADEGGADNND